jgi:hypothetical protein
VPKKDNRISSHIFKSPADFNSEKSPEKEGDVPEESDAFDVSNLMMQELPVQR